MSPKSKLGHTQVIGGNQIKNSVLEKLKYISKRDSRSQAKELEWLINERYKKVKSTESKL